MSDFEILVPVRNGGPLLSECLESLLACGAPEVPVTVVDNASDDDTPARVAAIASRAPQIRHLRFEERTDLAGSFNRCITSARADHFALIHADDRVRPDYVVGMRAGMAAHPEAWLIFCQGALIDDDGAPVSLLKHRLRRRAYAWRGPLLKGQAGMRALASYNHLIAPCAVYARRNLPEELRFESAYRYLVDQIFWLRVLLAGGQIAQLPSTFYEHRVHAGQLSASLRGASSTLAEIEAFAPALTSHPRVLAVWRRYGRLLLLRKMLSTRSWGLGGWR